MAALTHNAHQIAIRVGRISPEVAHELESEHTKQAQLVARTMRDKAPKFQSILTNSIHVEARGRFEAIVRPGVDYAIYREKGTRPGKGLPRFSDPAAGDIIAWLERTAFAKTKAPRRNSRKAVQRNLELRDRYEGLAWHVRHFGTKATPFVEPTAVEMAAPVAAALRAAVTRGIARAGGGTT